MSKNTPIVFAAFFFLSLLLFFLSTRNIFGGFGIIGNALFPMQHAVFQLITLPQAIKSPLAQKTQDQTLAKAQSSVDYQTLKSDNTALRSQFETAETRSLMLLPAHVIGAPQFLPGVGEPESIVIDQGSLSGVSVGQAVVYKDNLVGSIDEVRPTASLVRLVSANGVSFPAKTNGTNALGVLKGAGNGTMVLDNVVLADELQKGDLVITQLGQDINAKGFPPGLVIGKITSVEKNPSNLFQRASIVSLVDTTKTAIVFVVKGTK